MFTNGQLVFAGLFFIVFVIIMIFSYKGDKRLHKKYYKGSIWVLVGFIVFVTLLILVKNYFKS
ncbi:hypothetical protein QCQ61_08260 [Aequorivita marisscotiae]|uniref:DUF3976 domain-containing protein n=1 Tax=Aequorivita marisscotiae TaxID=3040348 RepID=A0ABY8KQ11_9FLAO|nr:hypothetical protein [Aequorivita sp. Ant34-E75]WGF91211.1 hypothetical protein QCQ61_08260 [Aequorivita sp. Ant34-E75]